jgi:hypothetical protein
MVAFVLGPGLFKSRLLKGSFQAQSIFLSLLKKRQVPNVPLGLDDPENVALFHDGELFTIDLNLGV